MCWGAGILLSSGVVRAVAGIEGDLGWRLPFVLQWVWPIPLFIGAYLAPESPWNAVRRDQIEEARNSLMQLREDSPDREREVAATLAYIQHTTALEKAETANASFFECFQGTNLRRTEIVRLVIVVPPYHDAFPVRRVLIYISIELRRLGRSDSLRQRHPWLFGRFPRDGRFHRAPGI